MDEIRDAIMNALGLCETLIALRDDVPAELCEGAELVKSQLLSAVDVLDGLENDPS